MADTEAPTAAADIGQVADDMQNASADGVESDDERGSDCETCCSDDTDTSEASIMTCEQEGYMLRHCESPYLTARRFERSSPTSQVDYAPCSSQELKRFVCDRGLTDPYPSGLTLKYFYIKALLKADREWRFRFLDLPPEMRNHIYRHLLHFQDDPDFETTHAYTGILGTCRSILQEAKGILYRESPVTCHLWAKASSHRRLECHACIHNEPLAQGCGYQRYFRTPMGINDYPEYLRRIQYLNLEIVYEIEEGPHMLGDGYWVLNHCLWTLASFLMDGHDLTKLDITLVADGEDIEYNFDVLLNPLRRLRNIAEVSIYSDIPNRLERRLIRTLQDSEPAFNTLRTYQLLVDEANAQLGLLSVLHTEQECECGECPLPAGMDEITDLLCDIAHMKTEACFNDRLEEAFQARLFLLQRTLDSVDATKLQERMKQLKSARKARRNHDSVADEGKLAEAFDIWKGHIHDDTWLYRTDTDDDSSEAGSDSDRSGTASIAHGVTKQSVEAALASPEP